MKDKPQQHIVQMDKDELSPKDNVRVVSLRKQSVKPVTHLMLSEKDKYTKVSVDTYQRVFDVVSAWDTFDMVSFTLQWPNAETISITRSFFCDAYEMPITESVIKLNGDETSGQVYVRNDVLATYEAYETERKNSTPNVCAPMSFIYQLFMSEDADWDDVVASCASGVNLASIVLNKEHNGMSNFVRGNKYREHLKFITKEYVVGPIPASLKEGAEIAVTKALKSIAEVIALQVYGELSDASMEKVICADVHFSSLGLVTEENKLGFHAENVYATIKNDQLHLVFGALDKEDGTYDMSHEFDLDDADVAGDKLKTVKLIYPNLV